MRDNKKMILFIKKHIEIVLIALGILVLMLFAIYIVVENSKIINTWEGVAVVGFGLSYSLLVPGMWIASEKMKEKWKTLSIIIKVVTIIECIALLRFIIAFLFKA